MKAKLVRESLNEKFHEDSDPVSDMGIGYGKKPLTKTWKVIEFIKSKGEEGASLTEIQFFIWTEIKGYSEMSFWEPSETTRWQSGERTNLRKTRGYWNTALYGDYKYEGILHKCCKKNEKGKWVFVKYPNPG
jgi:hypothetical protein